jgi:transposase
MILVSTITCPRCGHQADEQMPTDACQFFYECKACGERIKAKSGDCCQVGPSLAPDSPADALAKDEA